MVDNACKTGMVSPTCQYENIIMVRQIIRKLKEVGVITNSSCGIHVHIDISPFDARTLRNITNIVIAKEDLIYRALKVSAPREHNYCRKVEQRFLDDLDAGKPRSTAEVERI